MHLIIKNLLPCLRGPFPTHTYPDWPYSLRVAFANKARSNRPCWVSKASGYQSPITYYGRFTPRTHKNLFWLRLNSNDSVKSTIITAVSCFIEWLSNLLTKMFFVKKIYIYIFLKFEKNIFLGNMHSSCIKSTRGRINLLNGILNTTAKLLIFIVDKA